MGIVPLEYCDLELKPSDIFATTVKSQVVTYVIDCSYRFEIKGSDLEQRFFMKNKRHEAFERFLTALKDEFKGQFREEDDVFEAPKIEDDAEGKPVVEFNVRPEYRSHLKVTAKQ